MVANDTNIKVKGNPGDSNEISKRNRDKSARESYKHWPVTLFVVLFLTLFICSILAIGSVVYVVQHWDKDKKDVGHV